MPVAGRKTSVYMNQNSNGATLLISFAQQYGWFCQRNKKFYIIQGVQCWCASAIRDLDCAGNGNLPHIKSLGSTRDLSHMPVGLLTKLL